MLLEESGGGREFSLFPEFSGVAVVGDVAGVSSRDLMVDPSSMGEAVDEPTSASVGDGTDSPLPSEWGARGEVGDSRRLGSLLDDEVS
jgi:hypothetical protein